MVKTTKRDRDAAATRMFLELVGWAGEFHPVPGVDELVLDRFWSKIDVVNGHWLWSASSGKSGPQFGITPGRMARANRLAWMLMRGEIGEGMVLLRENCDHLDCIRPACFRETTLTEALSISGKKGGRGNIAHRPGSIPVNCSQRAIDLIRAMHSRGLDIREVAFRLGLGPGAIKHILKGNARGVR